MSNIQIFQNSNFGTVRVIEKDGEPWFVAADVCKALEIGNPSQALTRLDEDEKFTTLISNEGAASGMSNAAFINEPGLYSLVLGSRKPEAKAFKRWITHEVIPTIRKTGLYAISRPDSYMIDDPIERAKRWIEEEQDRQALRSANQELTTKNKLLAGDSLTWADRPFINAVVRAYATQACDGDFAQAWVNVKKELLYKYGINLNSRITAYMNKTGKRTKPKTLDMLDDSEIPNVVSTVVALCDANNVNIHDLVGKFCQEIAC